MMTKYKGTVWILSLCVIVESFLQLFPEIRDVFAFNPGAGWMGWVALPVHIFAHGGWGHLIGNFVFGLPFLMYLETRLGYKRLIDFYVLTGIAGSLLNYMATGPIPVIGSSGSIMGCFAAACMVFGTTRREHALAMLMMAAVLVPNLVMLQYQMFAGIAFYAHVGSAITGMALISRLYRPGDTDAKLPKKSS